MNQSEQYRKELLDHARSLYSDRKAPPAVHPRYGNVYSGLYGDEKEVSGGTFGFRMMLALLLFAAFITLDYRKTEVLNVNCAQIANAVEQQADIGSVLGN